MKDESLRRMWSAGNRCTDNTERLLLQSAKDASEACISNESNAEAPYILFFSCSIDLNGSTRG